MKCARKVLLTVLVIFTMALGQGYARTPDQALEHPIFLTEIDDVRMIFATYALKDDLFLSYSEYDTSPRLWCPAFRTNLAWAAFCPLSPLKSWAALTWLSIHRVR